MRLVLLFARENRTIKECEEAREMGPTTDRTSKHNIINVKYMKVIGS